MDGKAGSGLLIQGYKWQYQHCFPLGHFPSVFQAEVAAILATTSELLARETKEKTITIYCDSQATLKALQRTTDNDR